MLYCVPVWAALFLPSSAITMLYFLGFAAIAFVNAWMVCECVASIYYTNKQRELHRSKPQLIGEYRLGAIIAAYLPNELTVLVDTVKAVSAQIHCLPETTTLDIVLAHNGGTPEQRIALLEDLRKIEPDIPLRVNLHELYVVSSKSKAENVNAAISFFQQFEADRLHDFTHVAMYDADHQPIPEAYLYALETLQDQQADMVMGRCCVRDGYKFIAIEFDILYAVAHAGGRMVRGFGFFGGSNGYWDFKTLSETGMDETMLTEDVDSSFRAQAAGHKMTYDPTIVSYEESPPSLSALFKQRLRWGQGWAEVTVRQISLFIRPAKGLTLWTRFCIFLLLPFREAYIYLSSYLVPIAFVVLISSGCGIVCLDFGLFGLACASLMVPILMTTCAAYITKDRESGVHYRMPSLEWKDYLWYILVSYPYDLWKIQISVMAHARNMVGLNKWVVTKRKTTKDSEQPIYTMGMSSLLLSPELLVEESPYATTPRRFFANTFDARTSRDNHVPRDIVPYDKSQLLDAESPYATTLRRFFANTFAARAAWDNHVPRDIVPYNKSQEFGGMHPISGQFS
jgi:cellulose synthase/poly-beta-1,6-N-acetylglucosamine synthase-like glycosyltransferase